MPKKLVSRFRYAIRFSVRFGLSFELWLRLAPS